MALTVTNELGKPYIFDGSGGRRQIADGETQVIADAEWATVISAQRGPGKLNPQPSPITGSFSVSTAPAVYALELDEVGSITYVGEALPGAATSDPDWRIKRITETGPDIVIEWADGDSDLNNVWDDHLALTYL